MNQELHAHPDFFILMDDLFCDIRPRRQVLGEYHHRFFLLIPDDFKHKKHQKKWKEIQNKLKGRLKNYGTEQILDERITIQNNTIEVILRDLWQIHIECTDPMFMLVD